MLWVLLLSLGGIYGGVALLLCLFQSQLMHLPNVPGRELVATPSRIDLPYESVYLMTADGIKLHGWFVLAHQPHMTLLFLHGNAGNISHRLDALAIFHRLRLNTLIIDYRGYGQSAGMASEEGLYRDAEEDLRYLREVRSVTLQDIVIFGRSLGGPWRLGWLLGNRVARLSSNPVLCLRRRWLRIYTRFCRAGY
jgi:pimeloyl-ACP methyl ester carboxylesterase